MKTVEKLDPDRWSAFVLVLSLLLGLLFSRKEGSKYVWKLFTWSEKKLFDLEKNVLLNICNFCSGMLKMPFYTLLSKQL